MLWIIVLLALGVLIQAKGDTHQELPKIITGINYLITTLAGSAVGGLVVYFFSTRNMEVRMKDVVKEQISTHNEISHQESAYVIVERDIDRHKQECGTKMEKKISSLESQIRSIENKQTETKTIVSSMSLTLTQIARKMGVIQLPPSPENTGG
jgi:hypothetical protein